ncbi:ABC transporter [Salarchaeum sp. JOR-1]|uniref:ABC transporter n=1 Tax=Salarchaeum sp. JOR-1 TaxID=2599399 RepID=UPI0011983399|nr:ABC transporter [Salarchaeum sp. JOR-1]QDX41560.1 ABC transporter [Salarchaeum sp. JOR-1]
MALPPLLAKELRWGWRKKLPLFVLFVVAPAIFVYGTLAFEHVLPKSVQVAVAPAGSGVTRDDLEVVRAAVTLFSDPSIYESRTAAMRALAHERVYAVVTAPANLAGGSGRATVDLFVSGSVVPYQEPAQVLATVAERGLSSLLDRPVTATYTVVGREWSLSAYLLPTFLLVLVLLVALAYLPYNLASEEAAIDRLRLESSLSRVVATKLVAFTVLLVAPIAVFDLASRYLGTPVGFLRPSVIAVSALTFLAAGTFAAAVTVALRFSAWGRLANLAVLLFCLAFSGLAYPRGFFSVARRDFITSLPTYHAMVAARGFTLRGQPLTAYADTFVLLLGTLAVCCVLFAGSVRHYERGA